MSGRRDDLRAFEKVKGQIAMMLEDLPEPELRVDPKDRDPRSGASAAAKTPVGFGPNLGAYRTDLMFGADDVRCARCGERLTRTAPGAYRFVCGCWKREDEAR